MFGLESAALASPYYIGRCNQIIGRWCCCCSLNAVLCQRIRGCFDASVLMVNNFAQGSFKIHEGTLSLSRLGPPCAPEENRAIYLSPLGLFLAFCWALGSMRTHRYNLINDLCPQPWPLALWRFKIQRYALEKGRIFALLEKESFKNMWKTGLIWFIWRAGRSDAEEWNWGSQLTDRVSTKPNKQGPRKWKGHAFGFSPPKESRFVQVPDY